MTIAGRHDRYDGFGGTTNPKYSFKYQPVDWLAFRGAYSTGFKVPSFAQLFRESAETQYTNLDLADPAICRSEEHTAELQSLMRHSYAVFCYKQKKKKKNTLIETDTRN